MQQRNMLSYSRAPGFPPPFRYASVHPFKIIVDRGVRDRRVTFGCPGTYLRLGAATSAVEQHALCRCKSRFDVLDPVSATFSRSQIFPTIPVRLYPFYS